MRLDMQQNPEASLVIRKGGGGVGTGEGLGGLMGVTGIRWPQTVWVWCLCVFLASFGAGSGCQCGVAVPSEESLQEPGGEIVRDGESQRDAVVGDARSEKVADSPTPEGSERIDREGPVDGVLDGAGSEERPEPLGDRMVEDGGGSETAPDAMPDFQGPRYHFRVTGQTEDTVPPRLLGLSFGKPKIKAGEILDVFVTVDKDLSDVVSAQVNLTLSGGTKSLYVDMMYHPSNKRFEGHLQTSKYLAAGDWVVDRLYLQDGARNPSVYRGDMPPLQGLKVTVDPNTPDAKGPVVSSVSLEQGSVQAGKALRYTLEATDDVSGIAGVELTVTPMAGGPQIRGEAVYHPEQGVYVGIFRIPASGPDGKWQIDRADLRDQAGNFSFLSNTDALLQGKEFTVSGAVAAPPGDTTPPVLQSAYIAPLIVPLGEQIHLIADANDIDSGIQSIEVKVSDPAGAHRFQFNLFENASSGLWEGSGLVPFFSRIGIWRIEQVQLRDFSGNVSTYPIADLQQDIPYTDAQRRNDLIAHLHVKVSPQSGVRDESGPLIKGFHMSPGAVKAGESVRIFTRLEEPGDSGIASASCTFDGPNPQLRRRALLSYHSDTGFYEGNLTFLPGDPGGMWWVSGCFLTDQAGNQSAVAGWLLAKLPPLDISRATSNPAKDPFVIQVTNTTPPPTDTQPPVMKSMQIAPGQVKAGQQVRIFASVDDPGGAGVAQGQCGFKVLEGIGLGFSQVTTLQVQFSLHPATGLWEGNLSVPVEAVPGEWVLERCEWFDAVGNRQVFEGAGLASLTALTLTHTNIASAPKHRVFQVTSAGPPPTDQIAPVLEKIAIASSSSMSGTSGPVTAFAGDRVRVFAQVKELGQIVSAFCSMKPSILEPPRSSFGAAHLRLSPATGLWEGLYRIPEGARGGIWSLAGCQFEDAAGNLAKLGANDLRAIPRLDLTGILSRTLKKQTKLQVTSVASGDTTAPTAKDVLWLPAAKAKAGESLVLQLDAADQGGEVQRVDVLLESPTGKVQLRRSLELNPATLRWEAVFAIPVDGEDGNWKIQRIDVLDTSGNAQKYVYNATLLVGVELVVSDTKPSADAKAPEIKKVSRSKGIVVAGTSFRVSAEITDDVSGVSGASIRFASPSGKFAATSFLAWNANTSLWEGEVDIPKVGEDGVWKPTSMQAQDLAGRSTQLSAQDALFAGVVVTVRGATAVTDTLAPTIQNIELSPAAAKAGELLQVDVEAKDDSSGIASITVQVEAPNQSRTLYISLQYDPVLKRYSGTQEIPTDAVAGQWSVVHIAIVDNAGNRLTIAKGDPFLP